MKKKKETKKEVKVINGYYNYEKIFMDLQVEINKCETQSEIEQMEKLAEGFKKQDAPKELTDYIDNSIINKRKSLENKYNLDLSKLRTIANSYR